MKRTPDSNLTDYREPWLLRPLLKTYPWWGGLFFRRWARVAVEGRDRIPKTGGLLVLANHLSILDPPIMQLACRRRLFFMANREVFEWSETGADGKPPGAAHKFSSWLALWYGAFPVNTKSADRAALRRAVELLKAGETVCLFPEGGTSPGGLQPLFAGCSLIIRQAGCQVICAGIENTGRVVAHQSTEPKKIDDPIIVRWGEA
ncbi:MAG: 1-acyl-sn-glycerol-3-phosphate acyltransferase, partial [Fimbriimonadaceae bacterium]|nr:1-acyl-sn-glycerol-3-phosphate acyltransferase [Fimbriimonadaceae bacterium]